jgi:hypothetical protein
VSAVKTGLRQPLNGSLCSWGPLFIGNCLGYDGACGDMCISTCVTMDLSDSLCSPSSTCTPHHNTHRWSSH